MNAALKYLREKYPDEVFQIKENNIIQAKDYEMFVEEGYHIIRDKVLRSTNRRDGGSFSKICRSSD